MVFYLLSAGQTYLPHLAYMANKERIAATLCENKDRPALKCEGRCHLAKKIKEQEESSDNGQLPSKEHFEVFVHLPVETSPTCLLGVVTPAVYWEDDDRLNDNHSSGIFHPPRTWA